MTRRPPLLAVLLCLLALAAPATATAAPRPWAPLPGEVDVPATGGAVQERACAATRIPPPAPPRAVAAQAGPGVDARIRSALGERLITAEQAAQYEAAYDAALRTRSRLGGTRRAELGAVVRQLEAFARQRTLTASRMPALFRQLEQNSAWWAQNAPPTPAKPDSRPCTGGTGQGGARVIDRETVFQWYPGQGLQTMHLASAGRANALVKACVEPNPQLPCDRARVKVAMDDLLTSSSERAGGRAWEAYFAFGGGRPPWVSGLWQATAMQALARGSQVLGDPRYLAAAQEGLGIFERRPPVGVRVAAGAGVHYLGYSFNPGLRIYNQALQALVGLYDVGEIADDERARRLFRAGDRRARQEIAGADTGAWSRYSAHGAESDLGYHQLLRDFLRSLCERTKAAAYCSTADRFHRYLREPPGLRFTARSTPRAGAAASTRFFLARISCVTLKVTRDGRAVTSITRVLRRGAGTLTWVPPRRGAYSVQVSARDLANHTTTIRTTVRAR